MTHLTSLSVTIPLCDKLLPSQRDANRHAWPAAAAIADYAFSQKCLASMPCLKELALEIQHIMQSSRSPTHAEEAGNGTDNNPSNQIAAWNLPSGQLNSFSISGVALGTEQLNYKPEIQVRGPLFNNIAMLVWVEFSIVGYAPQKYCSRTRAILPEVHYLLCLIRWLPKLIGDGRGITAVMYCRTSGEASRAFISDTLQ